MDKFVSAIGNAAANLDKNSDAYKKVSAAANFLGKAGEKNGVTLSPAALAKNTLASAGPGGKISVDVKQISSAAAKFGPGKPGMSSDSVRTSLGAYALAHEARHELDFQRVGFPRSPAEDFRTELNAYRTSAGIGRGLGFATGLWSPGITPEQQDRAIETAAQGSVDAWCKAGGPCQ